MQIPRFVRFYFCGMPACPTGAGKSRLHTAFKITASQAVCQADWGRRQTFLAFAKNVPKCAPPRPLFFGTLSLLLFFGIILRGFGNLNSFFDDGAASWLKWPLD
jgi:hypothetical protein